MKPSATTATGGLVGGFVSGLASSSFFSLALSSAGFSAGFSSAFSSSLFGGNSGGASGVERGDVDARRARVEVVELEGAEGQVEVAVAEEEEVLAVRAEDRATSRRSARRRARKACLRSSEYTAIPGMRVSCDLLVGEPPAVGRPGVGVEVLASAVVGVGDRAGGDVEDAQALLAVAEGELLRVRAPRRRERHTPPSVVSRRASPPPWGRT